MKKNIFTLAAGLGLTLLMTPMARAEFGHKFDPIKPDDLAKIAAAVPAQARVKPAKEHRVLVFFLTEGFTHKSIPYGNEALKQIAAKTGAFQADFSEDMAVFTAANLAKYDAVIFQNTTRLKFADPAQRQALMDFFKSGKGLVGIHSASDNFYTWPEMQALLGGVFHGHAWTSGETVAIKLDDPDHPVNTAFHGKGFWLREEIYQIMGPYGRDKQHVLMSLDMSKPQNQRDPKKINRTDNDFPIGWVKKMEGGGRVFYSSLGHNENIFQTPEILQHYLDGIQFALGDLEASAIPSAQLSPQPQPALAPEVPMTLQEPGKIVTFPAPKPPTANQTTTPPATTGTNK